MLKNNGTARRGQFIVDSNRTIACLRESVPHQVQRVVKRQGRPTGNVQRRRLVQIHSRLKFMLARRYFDAEKDSFARCRGCQVDTVEPSHREGMISIVKFDTIDGDWRR